MGQGREREAVTVDSSVDAKGPDCVDIQRRKKSKKRQQVRKQGRSKKDFFKPEGVCV